MSSKYWYVHGASDWDATLALLHRMNDAWSDMQLRYVWGYTSIEAHFTGWCDG